jgi:hypothetical protein
MLALATACDERLGSTFGVTPRASDLVFTVQPSNVQVGSAIAPAVQVTVRNTIGETVTTSDTTVTISIVPGTGTSGAILTGTNSTNAINGVATFNNLRISLAGTGYQLTASGQGIAPATSSLFDVTP